MPLTNIYLIGPMGAGKSTIGRMLAKSLKRPFFDSDCEIEIRSGANIPWIFDVEGEEGFRERESQVLEDICLQKGVVLATGGGVVGRLKNRQLLGTHGYVVYLDTPVDIQLKRTAKDRHRPLLQKGNQREVLTQLFAQRAPLYSGIADLVIDTSLFSPKQIVRQIIQSYGIVKL